MLDHQHGNIIFECDGCAEVLATNQSNFNAAQSILKQEGWKPQKAPGESGWQHFCPKCETKL